MASFFLLSSTGCVYTTNSHLSIGTLTVDSDLSTQCGLQQFCGENLQIKPLEGINLHIGIQLVE